MARYEAVHPIKHHAGPAISAIVVVPDSYDELERTMQHLQKATSRCILIGNRLRGQIH